MISRVVIGLGLVTVAATTAAAIFFKEEIKHAIKGAQLKTDAAMKRAAANRVASDENADVCDVLEAKCASIYADMKSAYHSL